ncbi:MAG: class I SAM-dependent methyltransferase [Bacillota bacterium]|jgi:SAM-dependent MidA family methyltransferase
MSDTALRNIIKDQGPLTFASFMELVLYHQEYGYYNSGQPIIGKEGDFYTSVHVSSLFGELITEQLADMANLFEGSVFQLVEYGAGKGFLAYDILETMEKNYPDLFSCTHYYIIEAGRELKKGQQKLLSVFGNRVRWIDSLNMVDKPFRGCVLSNELVDAFPVHLVKNEEGELKEIYVIAENQEIKEITGPLSTPVLKDYFDSMGIRLLEGQRGEVCLAAKNWLKEIGETLDQGFVITIDYGYEADLLYHPIRKDGTIMCYKKHKSSPNPYINLGEQDITAHVNFTALQKWGNEFGLTTTGFTNQMHFLFNLGMVEKLSKNPEKALSAQHLLDPEGMGGIFKVLIQQKGTVNKLLKGLIPLP